MDDDVRRCHATILFSDVCGSTHLAETCDPEELALILSQVRQIAEEVINQHEGVINQFYGDGILAAFGFDNPSEDSVQKAVCAALELHRRINQQSFSLHSIGLQTVRMHSGIHSGLIVVQAGDSVQGRYKLYGDVLNTASRIADAASKNQILASALTVRSVLPFFNTHSVPPLDVKGKEDSIEVYEVLGRSDVQSRYEAAKTRGLTPFTGRKDELNCCRDAYEEVKSKHFRVLTVVGDAGLGKTRLVERWLESLNPTECLLLRGFCQSNIRGVPLQPFVDILKRFLGIDNQASSEEIKERIQLFKTLFGVQSFEQIDALHKLLAYSIDPTLDQSSSLSMVQAWADMIADIFLEQIKDKPMVLFIDDWHWADESSRLVLLKFMEVAKNKPLFVILSTRKLEPGDPASSGKCVLLPPFNLDTSKRVVHGLIDADFDIGLVQDIHERSGGNPLFIEELCLSLMNENRLGNKLIALSNIPATLHGLIEARVGQLPQAYAELVRTASILGRVFSRELLEEVLQKPLSNSVLETLAEQDLIYAGENEGTLRFKHGITRDVIYHSVVLKKRRHLHGKVARILEDSNHYKSGLEQLESLVYHYSGAGENDIAIEHAEKAGDKALAASSLDCARYHYRFALDLLKDKSQTEDVMQSRISVTMRWAFSCAYKPERENLDVLYQALECAEETDHREGCAQIKFSLGWIYYVLGKPLQSIAHLQEALVIARELGDAKLTAQVQMTLGQSQVSAGQYNNALMSLAQSIDAKLLHPSAKNLPVGLAYGVANKGLIFGDRGDFETAQECIKKALGTLGGASHVIEGSVLAIQGVCLIWQGMWENAKNVALRHKYVTERFSATQSYSIACSIESYAQWKLSRCPRALGQLQQSVDWMRENDFYMFSSIFIGWTADAFLESGDWERAQQYSEITLNRLADSDVMGAGTAYRTLAAIAMAHPELTEFQEPEQYLESAMQFALDRDSMHDLANANLLRAQYFQQQGLNQEAAALIATVSKQYATMAMSWHLAKANDILVSLQKQKV